MSGLRKYAQKIKESALEKVFILNTIPLPEEKKNDKIVVVNVADVLSKAIFRINRGMSVSTLYGRQSQESPL